MRNSRPSPHRRAERSRRHSPPATCRSVGPSRVATARAPPDRWPGHGPFPCPRRGRRSCPARCPGHAAPPAQALRSARAAPQTLTPLHRLRDRRDLHLLVALLVVLLRHLITRLVSIALCLDRHLPSALRIAVARVLPLIHRQRRRRGRRPAIPTRPAATTLLPGAAEMFAPTRRGIGAPAAEMLGGAAVPLE